jgi:hypothetical protein
MENKWLSIGVTPPGLYQALQKREDILKKTGYTDHLFLFTEVQKKFPDTFTLKDLVIINGKSEAYYRGLFYSMRRHCNFLEVVFTTSRGKGNGRGGHISHYRLLPGWQHILIAAGYIR